MEIEESLIPQNISILQNEKFKSQNQAVIVSDRDSIEDDEHQAPIN